MNHEGLCGLVKAERLCATKGDHHQALIKASTWALTLPLQGSHGDSKILTDEMFFREELEKKVEGRADRGKEKKGGERRGKGRGGKGEEGREGRGGEGKKEFYVCINQGHSWWRPQTALISHGCVVLAQIIWNPVYES